MKKKKHGFAALSRKELQAIQEKGARALAERGTRHPLTAAERRRGGQTTQERLGREDVEHPLTVHNFSKTATPEDYRQRSLAGLSRRQAQKAALAVRVLHASPEGETTS